MTSPVRLYASDHPALAIKATARIAKLRDDYIRQVGEGFAKSYDEYRYRTGMVEGLQQAINLLQDIEKELNKSHES